MRLALKPYQREAVAHLRAHPRAGLFLEMGLGKTAVTLSAITPEMLPVLVIAPKRVAEHVWPAELAKWRPDLSYQLAAGTAAKRRKALDTPADVHIIGVDNVGDVRRAYPSLVLDELSMWKNRGTRRWKLTSKLTDRATSVWGLTGTPAPKGYLDLWAQLYLLDKGERLGKYITHYRDRFFTAEEKRVKRRDGSEMRAGYEYTLRDGADAKINALIADICLAQRIEGRLELERPTTNNIVVPLPPDAQRTYDKMRRAKAVQLSGVGETFTAATAAVVSTKLAQITAGCLYPDDHDITGSPAITLHTAKAEAIREIADGTGSPLLVFYRFQHEREMLRKALPEARTIDERGIMAQWNAGGVPILLCQPQSAGHGLNLQAGGHTIVWASMTWSAEVYQQANARLFRQGQTRPVVIHRLLVPDSIDGHMVDVVEGRASLEQALMDHLDPAGAAARALRELL